MMLSMAGMKNFFRRITLWGLRANTSPEEANYLRLTNVLLLFLFFASIFETIACFAAGAIQAGLLNSTAPLVFGGGLLLMRTGRTLLARVLVLTVAYTAGHALATILGPDAQIQQIILFGSALSFTFFSLNRWKYILYGLTLPVVSYVLLEVTHYAPIWGFTRAPLSPPQLLLLRIVSVMIVWLLVIGQLAYHIRERRRSQERLVSSAKLAALGQMAAGIAHEINNPLMLILGQSNRLAAGAEDGPVPPQQALAISERIEAIVMRIGAIVRGLQTLSRDSSGDPFVEVPLLALLNLTLDYCRERIKVNGVELRVGAIPGAWTAVGRESQLSEVLLNVLNNALDATLLLEERWIDIAASESSEGLIIKVTDSGLGIEPAIRKKIFDPFFTTKPIGQGTGLGLSIARGIMGIHGGAVSYDEHSPRTRFVIQIPRGADLAL